MTLIFISAENPFVTLEAKTRSDLIAKIKGWYGFMKLSGHNIKGEDHAFTVFATPKGKKQFTLGTVSLLEKAPLHPWLQ